MKKYFFLLGLIGLTSWVVGQSSDRIQTGQVTFVTSSNVYVRFDHTENIQVGDTLRLSQEELQGCLLVTNKSSVSCVCQVLSGCKVNKGDQVWHSSGGLSGVEPEVLDLPKPESNKSALAENVYGMVSAATDISGSSDGGQVRRSMYRLSLNADQIKGSNWSMESYLTYRQNGSPSQSGSFQPRDLFNVYKLAVKYEVDSTLWIAAGRRVNPKITSLGASDGIQLEKSFGKFYAGALVGFRPDIFDNGFNSNLLQYGAYGGLETSGKNFSSTSTLGLLEQKNGSNVDRRYAYFQHNSYLGRSLNLFSSFEIDLYDKVNEVVSYSPRLTNLYTSLRYRINPKLNVSVSYDTRRRILFYETFRTQIEELLADDMARQGVRVRANVRPAKNLYAGASYGKRFQADGANTSDNINVFVSFSQVPSVGGRVTLNVNMNQSSYLNSKIVSVRHSRSFMKNKLQTNVYVRHVDYQYLNREIRVLQQYYGAGFSYAFRKKLRLHALGEWAMRKEENNWRINVRMIKRF